MATVTLEKVGKEAWESATKKTTLEGWALTLGWSKIEVVTWKDLGKKSKKKVRMALFYLSGKASTKSL